MEYLFGTEHREVYRFKCAGIFEVSKHALESFYNELIARLDLEPVVFKSGQKIEQSGRPMETLYFLEGGMASMTTLFRNGTEVEVGKFGYESVIGVLALMGTIQSLNHVYTQIEGTGYWFTYEHAVNEVERFGVFHNLCLRYVQAQLVQSSQSAVCAAMHDAEQRLARWLLISPDRAHVETFKMSQEFPSLMLGSTRPTVSLVAGTLKKEGLVNYKRGAISILDRKGLEKRACEFTRSSEAIWQTIKNSTLRVQPDRPAAFLSIMGRSNETNRIHEPTPF